MKIERASNYCGNPARQAQRAKSSVSQRRQIRRQSGTWLRLPQLRQLRPPRPGSEWDHRNDPNQRADPKESSAAWGLKRSPDPT